MRSPEESKARSQARAAQSRTETIEMAAYSFCFAWFLGGFIVIGYQIYHWLKTATWIELPLYVMFDWFKIDLSSISNMKWQGIKTILIWLLELPLSLMLVISGGLITWAVIAAAESD